MRSDAIMLKGNGGMHNCNFSFVYGVYMTKPSLLIRAGEGFCMEKPMDRT